MLTLAYRNPVQIQGKPSGFSTLHAQYYWTPPQSYTTPKLSQTDIPALPALHSSSIQSAILHKRRPEKQEEIRFGNLGFDRVLRGIHTNADRSDD